MHFETTQYRTGDLQDVICFLDDLLVVFRKLPPVTTSMVLRSMGWEEKEGDRVRKSTRSSLHRPKRSSSRQYYPPLPVTVRTKLSTYTTSNYTQAFHYSIILCHAVNVLYYFCLCFFSHDVVTLTVLKCWQAKWSCQDKLAHSML